MRFVIVEGVVLNTDAIDMIIPQGAQSEVSLRGGSTRIFNLPTEELLEHLRDSGDEILRVAHDATKEGVNAGPVHIVEESA
jgi:hypothetical protein